MSGSQSTPHEPERLEEMVSYLDGELSGEESARVEQRLATDEDFRQELQSIERAWTALDELPLATVEDRFAKTTMELVVQNARSEVEQKTLALPIQRRNRNLRNLFMIATAGLLGCLVFRASWQNPNRPLLADLAVIQNVEVYTQFRKVDFLRQLNRRMKSEAWPTDSDLLAVEVQSSSRVASLESPEEWLENLAEEERLSLRAKFNRFRSLPAEQQERLRELHEEISAAENAEALRQTMFQYQDWLGNLPASEQYELRELSAEPRVKRIMRMLRQDATRKSLELTAEELQLFFENVKSRVEQARGKLLERMSAHEKSRFESMSRNEQQKFLVRKMMDSLRGSERFSVIVQELIPKDKRQAFRKLAAEEKRRRFVSWMGEANMQAGGTRSRRGKHFGGEISEQDLEKHFSEELDAATIELLLALPREKMQQQLERRVRGGISRQDWERLHDRDHGPQGRHGHPRPGKGRRRDEPGLHDRRPGPSGDRPGGRPPLRRKGDARDYRPEPEDG